MTPWRIVFFGTPEFAVPSLQALLASGEHVVGVVCQPDRPSGRGQRVMPPPVKVAALEAGLEVIQPERVRTPEFLEQLRAWRPDLAVVTAYGRILTPAVLAVPPHGCINVHASLLPKYRGAAPVQHAILEGESHTGITIMAMDEGMDTGGILLQRETTIGEQETAGELLARLAEMGGATLREALPLLKEGRLSVMPQEDARATMAPLLRKEDGHVDWTLPAVAIARRVRAFQPWPSAWSVVEGKRLKILRAVAEAGVGGGPPGTLQDRGGKACVSTGEGVLRLEEVQPEGRRRMAAEEFLRGLGAGHSVPLA